VVVVAAAEPHLVAVAQPLQPVEHPQLLLRLSRLP